MNFDASACPVVPRPGLRAAAMMFVLILAAPGLIAQGTIRSLGNLPGTRWNWSLGISPEGGTIVGYSYYLDFINKAFYWTDSSGIVEIGPNGSEATAASLNGDYIVGLIPNPVPAGPTQAFRWRSGSGFTILGTLNNDISSNATGISDDGMIVVGTSLPSTGYRWTAATGMVDIGHLPGRNYTNARGISGDGTTIIGESAGNGFDSRAFASDSMGFRDLGVAGGYRSSRADVVTRDGSIVAGMVYTSIGGSANEAFRWEGDSMVALGQAPGEDFGSSVLGISNNGNLIITRYRVSGANRTGAWTPATGMQRLEDYLQNVRGVDLTDWSDLIATAMSRDGSMITGYGRLSGSFVMFMVTLEQGLTVVSPSAQSRWLADGSVDIVWEGRDNLEAVVELSTDGGVSFFYP